MFGITKDDFGFSIKEPYQIIFYFYSPTYINDKLYSLDEPILILRKPDYLHFSTQKIINTSNGNKNNSPNTHWNTDTNGNLSINCDVFTIDQLSFLLNAKITNIESKQVPVVVKTESDENGLIQLNIDNEIKNLRIYNYENSQEIPYEKKENNLIDIKEPFLDVITYYSYPYKAKAVNIGTNLYQGYLRIESKFKYLDQDGKIKTAMITFPKVSAQSPINFSFGTDSFPIKLNFNGLVMPEEKNNRIIYQFTFLNEEIDEEIMK